MKKTILMIILLSLFLSGCSYFKSSTRMDMAPFAEHTITLVAEISYGLNQEHAVYLRKYLHDPLPLEYKAHWDMMRPVLRGIASYSLALVTISKSNLTEKEKLDQLAKFIDGMFRRVVEVPGDQFKLTSESLDGILARIREQKKFLDGLATAQPIIDEVARYSGQEMDNIKISEEKTAAYLAQQIEIDNADVVEFNEVLRAVQARTFRSMILLAEFRKTGDGSLVDDIREVDPQLKNYLPKGNKLTEDDMIKVEERMILRLSEVRKMKEQIADDLETYRQQVRELDLLVRGASQGLMKTRATIWVWSRAHARLASGITDPAKVDMMAIAQKALKAAMPF